MGKAVGSQVRIYNSDGSDINIPNYTNKITYIDSPTTTVTYVGRALQGSIETDLVWAIKKIDSSSITSIMLSPNFMGYGDKWSERASLTYS